MQNNPNMDSNILYNFAGFGLLVQVCECESESVRVRDECGVDCDSQTLNHYSLGLCWFQFATLVGFCSKTLRL